LLDHFFITSLIDFFFPVSDFAKKTGDYASLSATDIKVIALTLLLEKENVGMDHIHQQPVRSQVETKHLFSRKTFSPLVEFDLFYDIFFEHRQTVVHKTIPSTIGGEVRQAANTPGFFVPKVCFLVLLNTRII
jgi:hypothetical protein